MLITLDPAVSPNDRSFYDVGNDDGARIDVFAGYEAGPNPGSPPLTVVIDGHAYTGVLDTPGNWETFDGLCFDAEANAIDVHLVLHHVTRTVNSGRTHYHITTWFINSGTITV